ncbi:SET domain-containing protein-like protein [Hapsidospora chrysogenum ATCC 11550]|uniref:SET domain-containing protein-like protein n=1 Tax=Hapsidospora chrysogenum (strain ATCC 11550 / CBS 779.69 / DSM 880 / IAM 14645 / JCM 23072 / IMI 49137) TaxID=857340 RepID=A0A086T329_HAPC1|nr:SET domain-containing protein-like protein [Hapsidospora chrysogenum ATCC 11550]
MRLPKIDEYVDENHISIRDPLDQTDKQLHIFHENHEPVLPFLTEDTAPKYPVLVCSLTSRGGDQDIGSQEEETSTPYEVKLYRICPVPGKGLGLVAKTTIRRGQRILLETPLIRQDRYEDDDEAVMSQYRNLSDEQKRQIMSLHNVRPGWEPLAGVTYTNAIALGRTGTEVGLFATASRINHACSPNTTHSWRKDLERLAVYATRDIEAGEEITSNYIKNLARYKHRQRHLRQTLCFTCSCWLCELPPEERLLSDNRIRVIDAIGRRVRDNTVRGTTSSADLRLIRKLLQLYEQESVVDDHPAIAYRHAFLIALRHGHGCRASIFAERSAAILAVVHGEDGTETRMMREWAREALCKLRHGACEEQCPLVDDEEGGRFEDWLFEPAHRTVGSRG